MEDHVESIRGAMFHKACEVLDNQLTELAATITSALKKSNKKTLQKVGRDYKSALTENRAETLSGVAHILSGVNARFDKPGSTGSAPKSERGNLAQGGSEAVEHHSGDIDIKIELSDDLP